ncbi:MAG: RNA polymerase-associated protein RapA, partial [Oceanospirillaceae bacterium]|nr:RNA polymerase-associated protein RapA [Oceanospirillaceae bacterium]
MSQTDFKPGQRWVSNTESELGLGVVELCENRRVEINFPAVGESRTYAVNNAPLSRIVFVEGDRVQVESGEQVTILDSVEHQGNLIYHCEDDSGEGFVLPERLLASDVHFTKPSQRLFAGQIDRHAFYKLRIQTQQALAKLNASPVRGLLGARVQLLPHQFHIASELSVLNSARALLADEVGLGKTIEAGLVMHQRLITGRAKRVLVVVPDNLQHQWLVELLRRFNLSFSLYDAERLTHTLAEEGGNPFESNQLVIVPMSLLTQHELALELALLASWDMLVVDEAHHLGWSEEAASHGYLAIEQLCRAIESVLLLSATPEHLGPEGHFARLRLLDPQRFSNLDSYLEQRNKFEQISALVEQLEQGERPSEALVELLGADPVETATNAELIDLLVATQGPGRTLFRNSRRAVSGFPKRLLNPHRLEAPEGYAERASTLPLSDQLHPERVFGVDWIEQDPRVAWLSAWLKQNAKRKTLLICANAQTVVELEEYLNLRLGVRCAAFHEGMSLVNRDRAAAYFADREMGAQLLVCSEIGSEGRNFQFASDLILFDLPPNPDLLEQRIGRLDRIGQQQDVQIHVPFLSASATEVLFQWFDRGLQAFTHISTVGDGLYRGAALRLSELMHQPNDTELEQLINETAAEREALELSLAQGRDRLLELNSQPVAGSPDLVVAVEEAEQINDLQGFAEHLFDRFGLEMQPRGANGWVVRPGEEMVAPLTTLDDEGLTLTFSRDEALARDDIAYMSWEHPLMIELMELIHSSEFGNASVCTLKLPALPPGTVLLETYYRAHLSAPRALQLERFFERPLLRYLIDPTGRDLAAHLAHEPLNKLAQPLSLGAAQKMIRMLRATLEPQLNTAENLA